MSAAADAAPATFSLDGEDVPFGSDETIIQAATRAGRYIPHLCWHPDFHPSGSCRLCIVKVDGRAGAACTLRAAAGQDVESNTEELNAHRKTLLQMLFVEGNHFCPSCEKSGNCLLQATAYQMGMEGPHFEEFYPSRPVDASHPDILLDFNRCILCRQLCPAQRHPDPHRLSRPNQIATNLRERHPKNTRSQPPNARHHPHRRIRLTGLTRGHHRDGIFCPTILDRRPVSDEHRMAVRPGRNDRRSCHHNLARNGSRLPRELRCPVPQTTRDAAFAVD